MLVAAAVAAAAARPVARPAAPNSLCWSRSSGSAASLLSSSSLNSSFYTPGACRLRRHIASLQRRSLSSSSSSLTSPPTSLPRLGRFPVSMERSHPTSASPRGFKTGAHLPHSHSNNHDRLKPTDPSALPKQHSHEAGGCSSHDHDHGHSHGLFSLHHHHKKDAHGADLLVSKNKHDPGVRITRIGLAINLAMALSKGVGGYVFHSQALTADAVHSLSDLVSDVMTLATISLALHPPTKRFPNGYGKFETLGSLGVSSILLLGGALMGWAAVVDLCHIYLPAVAELCEQIGLVGHSHSHHHHDIPNIQAAWLAGGSIVIKEWLYRATMKVSRAKRSAVLESNAIHHRVDSLTAAAALVSIAASNLFPAFHGIDALGSLLITYMVVRTGWANTKAALIELADEGLDRAVAAEVKQIAQLAIDEVRGQVVLDSEAELSSSSQSPSPSPSSSSSSARVAGVRGVKAGQNFLIDVAVEVPESWSVRDCQAVETAVRERVGAAMSGVRKVSCRFVTRNQMSQSAGSIDDNDGFSDQFVVRRSEDGDVDGGAGSLVDSVSGTSKKME